MENGAAGAVIPPAEFSEEFDPAPARGCAVTGCQGIPEFRAWFRTGFLGDYCGACLPMVCQSFDVASVDQLHG